MTAPAPIASIPFLQGEQPVFAEPWEARIFAIVLALHASGNFAWPRFQGLLSDKIKKSEAEGHCDPYYESWFEAAETLIEELHLADHLSIDKEVARLRPDDKTIRHTQTTA
jgi:nitrile hydratase accessory protein